MSRRNSPILALVMAATLLGPSTGCSSNKDPGGASDPALSTQSSGPQYRTAGELWEAVNKSFSCQSREEMIVGQWNTQYGDEPEQSFSCGRVDPEVQLIAEGLVGVVDDAALDVICVRPEDYKEINHLRDRARSTPVIVGGNWVIAPAYVQEPWPPSFKAARFARKHDARLTTVGEVCPGW